MSGSLAHCRGAAAQPDFGGASGAGGVDAKRVHRYSSAGQPAGDTRPTSHLKAVDGDGASLLAYRFNASEPLPQLTITAERRPPHCTVTQMLLAGVESGNQLKYTAMFKAEVIHSGVKSLAFAVPAALLPRVQLTPSQYRLQPAEKQPTELPEGYQAVNLQGDAEFFGASYFSMRWTEDLGDLPVGGEKSISLPRLIAYGDRVWGQIAFLKNDMIDMAPTAAEKLLPIDRASI